MALYEENFGGTNIKALKVGATRETKKQGWKVEKGETNIQDMKGIKHVGEQSGRKQTRKIEQQK